MGEQPVFSIHAHVFAIDPQTKKSWIHVSSQAVEVSFFYDPIRECYRIISVDDSTGTKRVVIHSSITEKMVFKKTSQKFGQWSDTKANQVYGLGFSDENELQKFINQFNHAVEAASRKALSNSASVIPLLNTGGILSPDQQHVNRPPQQQQAPPQQEIKTERLVSQDVNRLQEQVRQLNTSANAVIHDNSYDVHNKDQSLIIKHLEAQNAQLRTEVESLRSQLNTRDQRIVELKKRLKQQVQSLLETSNELDMVLPGVVSNAIS